MAAFGMPITDANSRPYPARTFDIGMRKLTRTEGVTGECAKRSGNRIAEVASVLS